MLPTPHLLVAPYTRREAVLSSRIEGTQASLSDLFYFEAAQQDPPKGSDVREVFNYVHALNFGLARLTELPLSLRLMREVHEKLISGVRGELQTPGEFRRRQNWIGPPGCTLNEATFVPPMADDMLESLSAWELFIHDRETHPPLIQCALMHYQFEAIHPFLDGNGRVGRLLITLFLCERGHLPQPLLYLSAFFERYRNEYYQHLLDISRKGDWDSWLLFFLRGVRLQAADAVETAQRIMGLQQQYREKLLQQKASPNVIALLDRLFLNPYLTASQASKTLQVTFPTAQRALRTLTDAGILKELTVRRRNRVYFAEELLRVLEGGDGTTPSG